jgi:hypothetical protein
VGHCQYHGGCGLIWELLYNSVTHTWWELRHTKGTPFFIRFPTQGMMYPYPSQNNTRCYQIIWEVVGLERGPLSLVSTTEELLGRNSSGSGLENRKYGRRDPSLWPRGTLYPQTLALTSPTSCGRSVGIVRSRTQATEFSFSDYYIMWFWNVCTFQGMRCPGFHIP